MSGYPARVAGCMLGKFAGDVLGAPVEGWAAEDIRSVYPDGLTSFAHTERGLLQRGGRVDDVHAARCYADEYQSHRGYGGTAYKVLACIKRHGINSESIKTIGTEFIPSGSFGNGGAMRIAPLGLVYRHAPPAVLRSAVAAALRCTHVHPTALDGALVVALAVGYLATRAPGAATARSPRSPSRSPPQAAGSSPPAATQGSAIDGQSSYTGGAGGAAAGPGAGGTVGSPGRRAGEASDGVATPAGLLGHLLAHSAYLETAEMVEKLRAVQAALGTASEFKPASQPWHSYFASRGWAAELQLQATVAEKFQIRADDAAAAAVAALCWHWACPEDAVVAAVHYGGDTDTVAAITGALAGALHGTSWIPLRWWDNLENGPAGRDEVLALATQLAALDTTA
ncbi:hypothetical protein GPECTOR_10g910 [Gonium pectorale]|uniref:ADP-ribosylhydrolase ARH3 n=1 Tax=Gonium pectorale TaxID=33097 RepID=A0A150GRB1_GONPE|nr:hypothetical protein GPECTOR_10g910 [Gonium pectorale]|eukprot:KXZ52278.1 hypothetical protein GPECTOR_10g910 [Gonium pectorale]